MIGWTNKFSDDYATAVMNGEVDDDLDRMVETITSRKRRLAAPANLTELIVELENAITSQAEQAGYGANANAIRIANPELYGRLLGLKEALAWENGEIPDYENDPYLKNS